jgi:penicillin-binding protein 2
VRQPIHDGLVGVTQSGTAASAFSGFNHAFYPVAGKTGTAQVDNHADTALFAAYGPAPAPQYSIAVVMEQSGFGGRAAAPVSRALFDVLSGAVPRPEAGPGGVIPPPGAPLATGGSYD